MFGHRKVLRICSTISYLAVMLLFKYMCSEHRALSSGEELHSSAQRVLDYSFEKRRLQTTDIPTSLSMATVLEEYGAPGVLFDVKAIGRVRITAFELYSYRSTKDKRVQIYTRIGTYIGHEMSSNGWSLIYDNDKIDLNGINDPFMLTGLDVTILPGAYQSFFIWSYSGEEIMYSVGTTEGALHRTNDYLEFYEGAGTTAKFSSNSNDHFAPRVLWGQIKFDAAITEAPSEVPSSHPSESPR
jgi:hypothetical protein|eukprot:scaffold779_cov205-Alexandrium_tamarense.AAC.19